jgi:hypothetical protein
MGKLWVSNGTMMMVGDGGGVDGRLQSTGRNGGTRNKGNRGTRQTEHRARWYRCGWMVVVFGAVAVFVMLFVV